jgi:hypothetical protein
MSSIPSSVTVTLPTPTGRYSDDFGSGVTIGASSSRRVDGVWVWAQRRGELSPDEAREMAAALLAAACAADAENAAGE